MSRRKDEDEYERRTQEQSKKLVRLLCVFILVVICGRALASLLHLK